MPGGAHTGASIPTAKRQAYFAALDKGLSKRTACKIAGIGHTTANVLERAMRESQMLPALEPRGRKPKRSRLVAVPAPPAPPVPDDGEYPYGPKPYNELTEEAQKAYDDFAYFRQRYLGRGQSDWQVEAAHRMLGLLDTPDREYVVVNAPPGQREVDSLDP